MQLVFQAGVYVNVNVSLTQLFLQAGFYVNVNVSP